MTDQPFMGSFTPPPEPREFAPNVHHSQSRHSTPQRTHHLPSMATGVSTQQYVQVSPYAQASQSPFAAGHTGSTHMGDTSNLSHAFMQVDLHSTPRSSGFTGDRSGIPASAFPMLGGSVGHRAENSSFMSGSIANVSPMPSARQHLAHHRHSPFSQNGDMWSSPREGGVGRMDSHFSGCLYAQPMGSDHQHATLAGLQPTPANPQYQPARSAHAQHHVPPLGLMGMQPRQSVESMHTGHWQRPLVGISNSGNSHQGSPRVSLDTQNSSGVRRKGPRRSQRRHSSSAIYPAGFGDVHGGSQRSARIPRQSNNAWDAVNFRRSSGTAQGDYTYRPSMQCWPRGSGDDSPAMSPRGQQPLSRGLTQLTEDYAEGLLGAGCGTMPQSWNSAGNTAPTSGAPDYVSCGSNMTTGSPRMRDACTSLQCLSVRQTPRDCGASMQHLYESGFLDHATPEAGLGRSLRLQGGSDGSDAYIDSFDGTPREGALRSAPQAVSQFVGKMGD